MVIVVQENSSGWVINPIIDVMISGAGARARVRARVHLPPGRLRRGCAVLAQLVWWLVFVSFPQPLIWAVGWHVGQRDAVLQNVGPATPQSPQANRVITDDHTFGYLRPQDLGVLMPQPAKDFAFNGSLHEITSFPAASFELSQLGLLGFRAGHYLCHF